MKYGAALHWRSVPQWAYQNVAYDSIKRLIKEHTSGNKDKLGSNPGQDDKVDSHFEDQLFALLADEHANITLFVRSKSGEIDRRLARLARQIHNLQLASWPPSVTPARISPSRFARYARIEQQTFLVGEEIKLLSRYMIAQRTAFVKLLKKYRKWTGRSSLHERWQSQVINAMDSFTHFEIEPFLLRWTRLLHEIRFIMGIGQDLSPSSSSTLLSALHDNPLKQSSILASSCIQEILATGSDLDFDTMLASLPLGSQGARASYWIHPEQLVEIQVLLLQHTRLAFPKGYPISPDDSMSPSVTRRGSMSMIRRDSTMEKEPCNGIIVLDDLNNLLEQQDNRSDYAEDYHSLPPSEPAVSLRWNGNNFVAVSLGSAGNTDSLEKPKMPLKLKTEHVASLLQSGALDTSHTGSMTGESSDFIDNSGIIQLIRSRLAADKAVQPLVGLAYNRTRFTNLPSAGNCGQWCTLDTSIRMKSISMNDVEGGQWQQSFVQDYTPFPYALLSIRAEGECNVDLIQILDRSHLTERVAGFSLITHALWTCCRPRATTSPSWLPILSGDIRKNPICNVDGGTDHRYQPASDQLCPALNTNGSVVTSWANNVSKSTTKSSRGRCSTVADGNVKQMNQATTDEAARRQPKMTQVQPDRYWNEYDDPEESGSENGYYIYVNPGDTHSDMPFRDSAKSLVSWFKRALERARRNPKDIEHQSLMETPCSSKGGLSEAATIIQEDSAASSDEDDTEDYFRPRICYGTLAVSQPVVTFCSESDWSGILLASTIALFFATVLSAVLLVLSSVGRKRDRGEVDVVILAGLIITLFSAMTGLWGLVRSGVSLVKLIIAATCFVYVVGVDSMLAAKVMREL